VSAGRVIVHLSDLHFGRHDGRLVRQLYTVVWKLRPHVVAVSGDLTQRALAAQFRKARSFMDGLPSPQLIVPGNHDVPLFNPFARLINPLGNYTQFITRDLAPTLSDDSVWITGVNTTRPTTWKSGRVDGKTLQRVRESIRGAAASAIRILVAHHPFDAPHTRKSAATLDALTAAGIDVFLTGHLHAAYTGQTAQRYKSGGRHAIVVEAATATSTRLREEPNGFNALRVSSGSVAVDAYAWDGATFVVKDTQAFTAGENGWTSSGG
jgi:3',5'-cyclic AMP phosphodiesterase CpdA